MIWHIITRELYDHLNGLRFALTTLILVALMVTNAIVHLQTHPEHLRKYSGNVIESRDALKSRNQLYLMLEKGPGKLYKRPSSLAFIADGGAAFLPQEIVSGGSWKKQIFGNTLKSIWWMDFPHPNMGTLSNIRPSATVVDWVFIITYLLSFIPLLFTFDAISGERERGTLRLCLANPISRHVLLLGKFLGAFIAVLIPFYFSVLLNLGIISTQSWTQFSGADWERLGCVVLIGSCYLGTFIAIGLIVSAKAHDSKLSLVLLLLIWVTVVIFMPSTLGTVSTKFMPSLETQHEFTRSKQMAIEQIESDFMGQMKTLKENQLENRNIFGQFRKLAAITPEAATELVKSGYGKVNNQELKVIHEYINKDLEIRERLNRERLASQNIQVQRARQITRGSPAAIVRYALESMAGTGFNRHIQFLEHAEFYIRQFRDFIDEMDRQDPDSLHLIGVAQGMSKKYIPPEAVPVFQDRITFKDTFNPVMIDMLLLVCLLGASLMIAFYSFLRADV